MMLHNFITEIKTTILSTNLKLMEVLKTVNLITVNVSNDDKSARILALQ